MSKGRDHLKSIEMKRMLEERLKRSGWRFSFDKEQDKLRIEDEESGKGMTLSLPGMISKYQEGRESVVEDIAQHVEEALRVMVEPQQLSGKEQQIYPVIRAASFPTETKAGDEFVYEEHTAETRVYYALDLGRSYRLIDVRMMEQEDWTRGHIREMARFNVRSLENPVNKDIVAENTFYFVNEKDGYDASRILNQALLEEMNDKAAGQLAVAVPHQDVLIFADLVNDTGYDVLGQMAMSFFTSGDIPITALPFLYENGELEPIFIMARKKPSEDE